MRNDWRAGSRWYSYAGKLWFRMVGYAITTSAILSLTASAETIALWNFETNTPADVKDSGAGPLFAADDFTGVDSASVTGLHTSKSTDWSTPAGNGSGNSFSANNWAVGDYFQFTLATLNYENIQVSWDHTRSATGPGIFDFAYSLDGTNFTAFFDDYILAPVTWSSSSATTNSSFSADLSSLAVLNHAASVTFRLIAAAAPSSASGASRVDNFLVSGSVLDSGTNSLFWDSNGPTAGLGGAGSWNGTNWASSGTGDTTVQLFESSKKAVFGGTGGNVVIDTADISTLNGIQFDSDHYIISATNARKLTIGGTAPRISVSTKDHRATITAELAGSNGLTKLGAGTLRLDAGNSYTGTTTITAGVLEITGDRSLGATSAGVAMNGGTLKTSGNIALHVDRSITGSGTLDVAASSTLTANGVVNAGVLALAGGGTVQLNGPSSTLSGLIFEAAATLSGSGTLRINGNMTVSHPENTSTITSPLDLGSFATTSGNRIVTVSALGSTLVIPGAINLVAPLDNGQATPTPNNNGRLHKLGAGVLELTGNNDGLFGIRLGSAVSSGSGTPGQPADGGVLRINNRTALGANTFQFNAGTLHIMQTLTGANAIPNPVTIGASSQIPAVISGADVEFKGEVQLFTQNISIQHTLIVDTNVLFSGAFNAPSGLSGTSTGLTFGGNGSVTLAAATNTLSEEITIDGPSVTINGSLKDSYGVHLKNGSLSGNGDLPFGVLTIGDGDGADAIFSPGTGIASYAIGDIFMEADAALNLELNSSQRSSDKLLVGGFIDFGEGVARLELRDLSPATLPVGFEFTIIENNGLDPVAGYFKGLPSLSPFTVGQNIFEIDYGSPFDPEDVVLRVIPEPGAATLLLAGATILSAMRRRNRGNKNGAGF